MKRHFPGLHAEASRDGILEGVLLVRLDRTYYRWHPQKPFFTSNFSAAFTTTCSKSGGAKPNLRRWRGETANGLNCATWLHN
jgi:hypothetical protein